VTEQKAAHAKAVGVMDEVYDLIEKHCSSSTHIDTELVKALKIDCEGLDLANHSTYLDTFPPTFFEPLPLERLPPLDLRNAQTREKYELQKKIVSGPSLYERTPLGNAQSLLSKIMWSFSTFPRQVPGDLGAFPIDQDSHTYNSHSIASHHLQLKVHAIPDRSYHVSQQAHTFGTQSQEPRTTPSRPA
jgi:hypothetical protein